MQSFLLSVSQDHKKIGCEKEASCKTAEFLDVLDKNLNADKTYDETRCLFVADCSEDKNVFNCLFQLASPEQSGKVDETGSIMAKLDSLKGREKELQSELRDIFKKKSDAQKRL